MSSPQGEWTPLQQQIEQALNGIPKYWGRPSRTHYATKAVDAIINGTQPTPSGWNQPKNNP